MRRLRRFLTQILATAAVLYVVVGLAIRALEPDFLFHPAGAALEACPLPPGTRHLRFDGEQALYHEAGGDRLAVVYHGNAQSACGLRGVGGALAAVGVSTLLVEYPGYGGDKRAPGRETIEATVGAAGRWAAVRYPSVAAVGFSMGGGAASLHAAAHEVERVILFAPYDSLYDLAVSRGYLYPRFWFRNEFDNGAALVAAGAPVEIVFGEADRIIPPRHALSLAEKLEAYGRDVGVTALPGRGHEGAFDIGLLADLLRRDP